MKRSLSPLALFILIFILSPARAEQVETYDFFGANRLLIRNGVQAVLTCNGLFTSRRTLDQVFAQELAYLPDPVGTAGGGEYVIDRKRKAVAIGGPNSGPIVRAAFREGIGCIVLAPGQSFDAIDSLPTLTLPPLKGRPDALPWPNGDRIAAGPH